MDRARSPPPLEDGGPSGEWRDAVRDAARYWEARRVAYNLTLVLVVLVWLVGTWPHFRAALTLQSLLALCVLAACANACYCAAYLTEIPMQRLLHRAAWRRARWVLWLAGMLVALVLANYWIADEIYPSVR